MSRIRADKFVDRAATGAPELTQGVNFGASGVGGTITAAGQAEFAGVCTASSFSGNVTGTASLASNLTGTPNITVGNITASSGDLTIRNVTGVAATFTGVLTYEDVTSVDSVGIVTARTGVKVLAGGVNVVGGGITATGIGTFHEGVHLENLLAEEVKVTAGKLSDNTNINIEDGMVHLFTTAESTTSTPNIRYNGSTALNAKMSIGQSIVVTLITTANASAYSANITIDGSAVTERWIGGSAPSDGGSSGVDIHSFTIIKTADATFTVIGNHSKTS
tara:strand:+ start:644 stop:1474 length:831 start_codon:yes stop_codon:yes gene_type:complete